MPSDFYSDPEYKKKQSQITKKYWQAGKYNFLLSPLIERKCINSSCNSYFKVKPYDPKRYCSHTCSAHTSNLKRGRRVKTKCVNCGILTKRTKDKYCSNKCQANERYANYITRWKAGLETGNKGIATKLVSSHLRRYLFEKYNSKCSECGWNKIHPITKVVPLEVDHIDGNAENNIEENLRLLCPNCHALTSTFRNLNKGKGRPWRLGSISNPSKL